MCERTWDDPLDHALTEPEQTPQAEDPATYTSEPYGIGRRENSSVRRHRPKAARAMPERRRERHELGSRKISHADVGAAPHRAHPAQIRHQQEKSTETTVASAANSSGSPSPPGRRASAEHGRDQPTSLLHVRAAMRLGGQQAPVPDSHAGGPPVHVAAAGFGPRPEITASAA